MDIDIDVGNRKEILKHFKHINASIISDNNIVPHNTGVYFQDIPVDEDTRLSSIDYRVAEKLNFFKIDFLNFSVYQDIKDNDHLYKLENMEPDWNILNDEENVVKLPHIHNHYNLVKKFKPCNIHELAALLALIRPGKSHLRNLDKDEIMKRIWDRNDLNKDGYFFKKSHAYAYAKTIIICMNKIKLGEL